MTGDDSLPSPSQLYLSHWGCQRGGIEPFNVLSLAAHREHHALACIDKLDAIEPRDVMRLSVEFSNHLERLISVLTDLAGLPVGMPAVIRDMRRSGS